MATFGVIIAIAATAFLFFLGIIANTLVGGIVGWVVDIPFPFVISTLNHLAGTTLTPFELGAVLGFFGSFFKSSLTTSEK